tara:strand:- start:18 stop:272 length:255 start_codon:yes stop_codon:yes gene_type:complete
MNPTFFNEELVVGAAHRRLLPLPLPPAEKPGGGRMWFVGRFPDFEDTYLASLNREGDAYDRLGRNFSAQMRRQKLEPWVLVVYK